MMQAKGEYYDLKEMILISAGDDQFLHDMVKLFITQTSDVIAEMETMLNPADLRAVRSLVHKIKPSVAVIGADLALDEIRAIEHPGFSNLDSHGQQALCRNFIRKLRAVVGELRGNLDIPDHPDPFVSALE